jgi:hypothetical protein
MSGPFEPALTAEEWADGIYMGTGIRIQRLPTGPFGQRPLRLDIRENPIVTVEDLAALAAFVNEALPDDHPLKITRDLVNDIRSVATEAEAFFEHTQEASDEERMTRYGRYADQLESYLKPDPSATA